MILYQFIGAFCNKFVTEIDINSGRLLAFRFIICRSISEVISPQKSKKSCVNLADSKNDSNFALANGGIAQLVRASDS